VELKTFSDYGREFARRYVPALEERAVTDIRRIAAGFELVMADGHAVTARRVICAAGIADYRISRQSSLGCLQELFLIVLSITIYQAFLVRRLPWWVAAQRPLITQPYCRKRVP
jgi:hypothetical protein